MPVQPAFHSVALLRECLVADTLIIHGYWQIKALASLISRRGGSVQFQRNHAFLGQAARQECGCQTLMNREGSDFTYSMWIHRTRWHVFHGMAIACPTPFLSRVTEVWIFLPTKRFRREAIKMTLFYYQDDKKFGLVKYVARCFPFWCVFPVHMPECGRFSDSPLALRIHNDGTAIRIS